MVFGNPNLGDILKPGYIVNFITPSLPLIVILIKIILDHQRAAKSLEEVRKAARKLRIAGSTPTMNELRQVQDKLYCSRRESALIPENYYHYRRTKLSNQPKVMWPIRHKFTQIHFSLAHVNQLA